MTIRPFLLILFVAASAFTRELPMSAPVNLPDNIRTVLEACPPLTSDRGARELVYQYSVGNLSVLTDAEAEWTIRELAARGIGVISWWQTGAGQDAGIAEALRIGRIQKKLGLTVACDANSLLYSFYDGTPATAHIDDAGQPFFDTSFSGPKMGCPFALEHRMPVILGRVAAYVEAYRLAGIPIGIVSADWEIDGPHEWNDAWASSKRCTRCRENLPNLDDFAAFQSRMRQMRSRLQRECYAEPILARNPHALVTNYAVYPNDGWRYWYDYFEHPQPDLPHRKDQNDLHRPWYNDFAETRFTLAMPVIYTWYNIYAAYPEFTNSDYRWFYNMLLVGSNAGKSTPPGIPIATFVHWHTTAPPADAAPVPQMSAEAYKELLWHLLLRGHDILYSWTPMDELGEEIAAIQRVYNESLEFNDWLREGTPISFDVPRQQGVVVSGVRMGNRVLVRRSDFGDAQGTVTLAVDGKQLHVPVARGRMQILTLE
jgi:hypothetical protein